jgi:hypothetical protein
MKAPRTKKEGPGSNGEQELTNQLESDTEDHRRGGEEEQQDREQMQAMQQQQVEGEEQIGIQAHQHLHPTESA